MSETEDKYRENQQMEDDEEMKDDDSDDAEVDEGSTEDKKQSHCRVHLPDQTLEEGEELVMDEQAYLVYHQVNAIKVIL